MDIVLLAAGLGTRFGGPKQLHPIGPNGETMAELTAKEAFSAGFDRVILIHRPEHRGIWLEKIRHFSLPTVLVPQKDPKGTAHALLQAHPYLTESYAVANADDEYGSIWSPAVDQLNSLQSLLIAYPLSAVLSPNGFVNRCLLTCDDEGMLLSLEERTQLSIDSPECGSHRLVSMNAWIFHPSIHPLWEEAWAFHNKKVKSTEFGIPEAVEWAIKGGHRIKVVPGGKAWRGLTYKMDVEQWKT